MKLIPFMFGVIYAAAGVTFSAWNLAEWRHGHREPAGSGALRFTRWQWAAIWACTVMLGAYQTWWSA